METTRIKQGSVSNIQFQNAQDESIYVQSSLDGYHSHYHSN